MLLPITSTSGCSPHSAVAPPGPAENVCVSSITSRAPYVVASSRSPSRKPGSGSTMPMLVSAGSASTAATSPCASCASTPARSLNSATRVVSASGTGAPTSPARATAVPSGPGTANASSTEPW